MTELENYIQSYFGVINDDLSKISDYFKPRTLKKGDCFIQTRKASDQMAFHLQQIQLHKTIQK